MCVCTAGMGGVIKEYGIAENISKKRRGSEELQQSDQGIESLTPRPKSYTSQVRKSKKVIPNLGTLDPIPGLESTRAITSSSLCRQPPAAPSLIPFPLPVPILALFHKRLTSSPSSNPQNPPILTNAPLPRIRFLGRGLGQLGFCNSSPVGSMAEDEGAT